jgi:hypothetical protein
MSFFNYEFRERKCEKIVAKGASEVVRIGGGTLPGRILDSRDA